MDNKAYLFSAPSGTGKSTHTQLWLSAFKDAKILNDDKPAIIIRNNIAYACGTPFSGKNDLSLNEMYPIQGIAFLERSKDNWIKKMDVKKSIYSIFNQTIRPGYENEMDEFFDTSVKHNGYNWLVLENIFDYVTQNRSNDYILKCSNQGSQSDATVMNAMVNMPYGGGKMQDTNKYEDRSYHTSLTDNAPLASKYSYQQINKNGDTALCYVGEDNESYVEFIFVIPNKDASQDYNFKFLIVPEQANEEDEGEEE